MASVRREVEGLKAPDCLLVASDWEGFPSIINEARACYFPVVSSRVGGCEGNERADYFIYMGGIW
jgi:glycosyltransferase involved in cell wall biosynthesis